uniref:cysteine dioxygenase n=1 Tax=Oryza sativa subsp. japonica TaxID=39947 RepID=Q8RUQ8_ORYSJ|nr:Hypothetical protein [Oryza sativa Japonica Group]AAM10754.1 Hypothetical protein [Oryza sativa Japonica Group]
MDSRRLSFPVDQPRVHSAGLSSPPPLLIATTTSPPACLRRRRLVSPPTRLACYAAVVGRLRLHRRLASVAADWCHRLHGWPIMPLLLGVYNFIAGLPPSPPTSVLAYMVGWSHHRLWASASSPTDWPSPPPTGVSAYMASLLCRRWIQILIGTKGIHGFKLISYALGMDQSEHHHRLAVVAADWCFRLHGWPVMPPLLGVYVFTDRLALVRRRLVFPPARLAYYAAVVGRLRLHRPAASSAADWCFCLHGWPIMPPLLGVYDFTDRPPRPPPTGVSACTTGLLCRLCWASTSSPTGRLVRRQLVFPPARLAYYDAN